MIQFKCHCGQLFSLGEEQAGGLIQCPTCGRLNDVPTLSDLKNIDEEGNYKLDELEIVEEPDRLDHLARAFTRSRTDDHGQEIDLRPTLDDVARAGVDEIPLAGDDDAPAHPHYDPLTGELVEPLEVKPDPAKEPVGALPMATPVLGYSTAAPEKVAAGWSVGRVGLELFQPVNVIVMGFILLLQLVLELSLIPISVGLFFLAPLMIFPAMALLGYFGKVVEETGPGEQDELPRPLGQVSLREDVWSPFVGVAGAGLIAFSPVWLVRLMPFWKQVPSEAWVILTVLGLFLFPAVLLTVLTSGSMRNLRPDRLVGVIRRCGMSYAAVVLLMLGSHFANAGPLQDAMFGMVSSIAPLAVTSTPVRLLLALSGWVLSLYLMLWACWSLGIFYRRHHDQFPWVLQRHEYRNRTRQPFRRPPPPGRTRAAPNDPVAARNRLAEIQQVNANRRP